MLAFCHSLNSRQKSSKLFPGTLRTRICQRNGGRVLVANETAEWRANEEGNRGAGSDHAGPEVGRALAGSPAEVADGAGVEAGGGGRHVGGW